MGEREGGRKGGREEGRKGGRRGEEGREGRISFRDVRHLNDLGSVSQKVES